MRKKKIAAFLMSAVMAVGMIPSATTVTAADTAIDKAEYQYFLNNAEGSAYAVLGEKIKIYSDAARKLADV